MTEKETIGTDDDDWSDVGDVDGSGVILETGGVLPAEAPKGGEGNGEGGDAAGEAAEAAALGTGHEMPKPEAPPALMGEESCEPTEGGEAKATAKEVAKDEVGGDGGGGVTGAPPAAVDGESCEPSGGEDDDEASEPGGATVVEIAAKEAAEDEHETALDASEASDAPPILPDGDAPPNERGSAKIDVDADAIPDTMFFAAASSGKDGDGDDAGAVPWTVSTTDLYGGGGGRRFNDVPRPSCRIAEVAVNAGAIVDGLRILYSDGTMSEHGGDGGGWRAFPLAEGEGIVEATVKYGRFVRSVEFRTDKGRTLGPCGAGGFFLGLGRVREVKERAPEGHVLAGIHGRRGKYIDGIGFHWGCMTA